MSDTTPTSLREILETLVKNFASLEQDSDGSYWWGHDTNLGDQSEAFDQAIAAITGLVPEKPNPTTPANNYDEGYRYGYTNAIDQTKRNFTGQTDNEREDSRI